MHTNITLLNIPSIRGISASPSTWKVRLALNHKRLNYRTQWVPSAEIEKFCKPLGFKPTGAKPDSSPHYTLPTFIDRTNPSRSLADSMPIVEYLEKTYPPSPGAELFRPTQIPFKSFSRSLSCPLT
ncbi:hypothetical protein CPB84DRAFT_1782016 [Gymnopilus junonius]|uniref:GST N-terminal domain-containing protein n=1 Tax=Gymnopilus junonius TaxID=109634 RepID=A0A9P5NLC8_GYMJU|nr:hypothetical protein CPB84DRAFT_1782016 [Gymnopilus junonius]